MYREIIGKVRYYIFKAWAYIYSRVRRAYLEEHRKRLDAEAFIDHLLNYAFDLSAVITEYLPDKVKFRVKSYYGEIFDAWVSYTLEVYVDLSPIINSAIRRNIFANDAFRAFVGQELEKRVGVPVQLIFVGDNLPVAKFHLIEWVERNVDMAPNFIIVTIHEFLMNYIESIEAEMIKIASDDSNISAMMISRHMEG